MGNDNTAEARVVIELWADLACPEGVALGVRGVPFTVFDRRISVSGAQSSTEYARALDQAIAARSPEARV